MLHDNNFENDYDVVIADTEIEADQLYSGYMYSNINNRRKNLTLKLLSAIDNIKSKTMVESDIAVPTITYHSKGCLILLND